MLANVEEEKKIHIELMRTKFHLRNERIKAAEALENERIKAEALFMLITTLKYLLRNKLIFLYK